MATKKSTTKKAAKTKKAARKTVPKAAKKTAPKAVKTASKKAAAKMAKNAAAKAQKGPKKPAKKKPAKAAKRSVVAELVESAPVAGAPPVDIAAVAYRIYLERIEKGIPGDEISDWAAAEQRVREA